MLDSFWHIHGNYKPKSHLQKKKREKSHIAHYPLGIETKLKHKCNTLRLSLKFNVM